MMQHSKSWAFHKNYLKCLRKFLHNYCQSDFGYFIKRRCARKSRWLNNVFISWPTNSVNCRPWETNDLLKGALIWQRNKALQLAIMEKPCLVTHNTMLSTSSEMLFLFNCWARLKNCTLKILMALKDWLFFKCRAYKWTFFSQLKGILMSSS